LTATKLSKFHLTRQSAFEPGFWEKKASYLKDGFSLLFGKVVVVIAQDEVALNQKDEPDCCEVKPEHFLGLDGWVDRGLEVCWLRIVLVEEGHISEAIGQGVECLMSPGSVSKELLSRIAEI
jgi:hypothetical protein